MSPPAMRTTTAAIEAPSAIPVAFAGEEGEGEVSGMWLISCVTN